MITNPTASFKTVTPDMAKIWLENNPNNRRINETNLQFIISEINREKFYLTGESIKLATDGTLLDGQHRLMAIIKSKKPIKILVVEGLDKNVFKYIDTGRKLTPSDVLSIAKIKNASKMSSMVKFIINFKRAKYTSASERQAVRNSSRITNADVLEFVQKNNSALEESYPYGFNSKNKLITGSILSSFHYIFNDINATDADDFCYKVATGEDIGVNTPIAALRQRMLQDIRSSKKMRSLEKIALICKAWNLYRGKNHVQVLKWNSTKEPFPKPI